MNSPLWLSRHDLPAALRSTMIVLLNQQLSDLIDLGLQAKQAHWNVKGPHFAALHLLFDELADTTSELVDEVAERAVALGGVADGTLRTIGRETRLAPYPLEATAGRDHLRALALATSRLAVTTRSAIDVAAEAGDAGTADVLTQASRALDKSCWQIEAHLSAEL